MTRQTNQLLAAALAALLPFAAASCRKSAEKMQPAESAEAKEATEEKTSGVASSVTLDPSAQKNAGVVVEPVRIDRVQQSLRTTGTVAPNQTRVAHVRPLAGGRVQKVHARLGDRVRSGQPLVAFDNIELGNALGEYLNALAALKQATTQADVSRRATERAKNLVELGAVAQAELERRDAEYRNALASVESQQAAVSKVELTLRRFGLGDTEIGKVRAQNSARFDGGAASATIVAPFSGVITKYSVAEGEVISPSSELMEISDLSTVWVLGNVYEKDLGLVRQGARAFVTTASYPGKRFGGLITYVSDFLNPDTRTAAVRCEIANPSGLLKLDMFVEVDILTSSRREALAVPAAAIQRIQGNAVVFTKTGGDRFEVRQVQLGPDREGLIEITSGLKAGESVVTQGAFALKSQLLKSQIASEHEEEERERK